MKNLLNSSTDGNMSSPGNPIQPANGAMNNTTLYGSLSGSEDSSTTYKQPYRSPKGDCGCNGAKQTASINRPQQMPPRNYMPSNPMPNPPNNLMPYPTANWTQSLPNAYPSKANSQTSNMANNSVNNPNK